LPEKVRRFGKRGKGLKRILIIVVLVIVVGAIVIGTLRRSRSEAAEVEIATVGRKELVARVRGSGRVEAKKSVSVTANVVGKVIEVAAEEGDEVAKGDLILRIDPRERQALFDQAQATLESARAEKELAAARLRQAEVELKRQRDLNAQGLGSEQALLTAQTEYDVCEATLGSARENVRNAEAGLEYARREFEKTIIRAEIDGVIVRLSVEEGENVLAGDLYNAGSPILEIADLRVMEAHVLVDETEVVHVRKDQPATVTVDAYPDFEFQGRVTEVGSSAYRPGVLGSQESMDYRIRILLESAKGKLKPGLSVTAEIETARRENALAVPIEALTLRVPERERELAGPGENAGEESSPRPQNSTGSLGSEKEGVFVLREDRVFFVPVETGIAGEKDFEVLSGLAEGDRVVRGPFEVLRTLESGTKVKVRREGKDAQSARDGAGDVAAGGD
jgi:HlyD family secretion protein